MIRPKHDQPDRCDIDFRRQMKMVVGRVSGARTDAFIARAEKSLRDRGKM